MKMRVKGYRGIRSRYFDNDYEIRRRPILRPPGLGGRSERALVACESGSILLEEALFTFELEDCVSEGWTQDGDIEISWDDSLVSIENPRTRWPLSASTSNYSETRGSPAIPARFNVIGVNEIAQSVVGSVDQSWA